MKEDKEDDLDDFATVKIFSSEDEKLKMLGELLSNKSSRDIVKLLAYEEMYINEISKKLDMRSSLVIHHLKKLRALGLLQITNKKIVRKGNDHKHFKMVPNVFVTLNNPNEQTKKNHLRRIFRNTVRFSAIIASIGFASFYYEFLSIRTSETNSLTIPLIVLLIGFAIHTVLHSFPTKRKQCQ